MLTIIKTILAFLEAIPILDKWYQALLLAYAEDRAFKNDEKFSDALAVARAKGDATRLRSELGKLL